MINDHIIENIYKVLEGTSNPTDLQKDILDSIRELEKCPLDRCSLASRIMLNEAKYSGIIKSEITSIIIQTGQCPIYKPIDEFSDDELYDKLRAQIKFLFLKSK